MATNRPGYMLEYYKKNKEKWLNKKETKKRTERNKARRIMKKKVGAAAIKNRDVNHKKPLRSGGKTTLSNLNIQSKKVNRGNNGHKKTKK